MEPTAVLIGRFEVEVGWNIKLRMRLKNCHVGRTGINPNIQGVAALYSPIGKIKKRNPFSIRLFKPNVGAVLLNKIGNFLSQISRDDGLTLRTRRPRSARGATRGSTALASASPTA